MKRIALLITLAVLLPVAVQAQGTLTVSNGSVTLAAGGRLHTTLDLTVTGALYVADGTVVLNGNGPQHLTPGLGQVIHNLSVNKPDGDFVLLGPLDVTGLLNLSSGDLDLNGYAIDLGATGTLAETPDHVVKGVGGTISATRTLDGPASDNVAGLGVEITTAANLGATVITRGHAVQTGQGNPGVARYVDINPAHNTGLDATLVFHYNDDELNGLDEALIVLFRSDDDGATWTQAGGAVDADANTITLSGIEAFSRWTAAEQGAFVPPEIIVTKVAVLLVDHDSDGQADPGDTIQYTVVIVNDGGDASDVVFSDSPGAHTSLVDGSVNPSMGTVSSGNDDGDTSVAINVGALGGNGASATITFDVVIDTPLPAGVEEVCNQGAVSGTGFDEVATNDPATDDDADPTCVPVEAAPVILATKVDALHLDHNENGLFNRGDQIRYTIEITNIGNQHAAEVVFVDTPPLKTTLNVGSVTSSQGIITSGNTSDDATVAVALGLLLAGGDALTITFVVTIDDPVTEGVEVFANQGSVSGSNVAEVVTDDPDTPAADDPTVSVLDTTPTLDPLAHDFGTVPLGQSEAQSSVLTNEGSSTLTITALTLTGAHPGQYALTGSSAATLAPGQSTTIEVSFLPTIAPLAPLEATLEIVTDHPTASPFQVSLTGQAIPALPHAFALLAEKKIKFDEQTDSEGAIHANDKVEFKKGKGNGNTTGSIHTGDVTASHSVKIEDGHTISGNVTAPRVDLKPNAVVTGTVTEASVDPVTLPSLSFSAGGSDVTVPRAGSQPLAPGSYGKVEEDATLLLESGAYFFESLEVKKRAILSVDVTGGVASVNVTGKLKFDKDAEVEITPLGEAGSAYLRFNSLHNKKIEFKDRARILGSFIAPAGKITLSKEVFFKGSICAAEIEVAQETTLRWHDRLDGTAAPLASVKGQEAGVEALEAQAIEEAQATQEVPADYVLSSNYPNPFNPTTTIAFALPEAVDVRIVVYDVTGREVARLVDGRLGAGTHQVSFDATGLASGVYLYRIQAGRFTKVQHMVLAK